MLSRKDLLKWFPLILLGTIGMFLSEFLIWNVYSFTQVVYTKGVSGVAFMTFFGYLMYLILFAVFADLIMRFKLNDFIGIVLLGSIYGLVVEGIFADTIFAVAGIGPRIFGIYLIHLNFTALSWHALIDFYFSFVALKWILRGKLRLSDRRIGIKEMGFIGLFCIFWFIWSYAQWLIRKLPQGIPVLIQFLVFFYPFLFLGITLFLCLKYKTEKAPAYVLNGRTYPVFLCYIFIFMFLKFISVQNKFSFFFFCSVIVFYILLFLLYIKFGRRENPQYSIYEEAFPISEGFNLVKYLKIASLIIVFYFIFRLISGLFYLGRIYTLATVASFILFNLFAVCFPLAVIFKIILTKKNINRVKDANLGH